MRILFVLLCAPAFAQNEGAIEKAVLAAHEQVTRAAEDRDIDRLFSFMAETNKGSIIQNGALFLSPQEAKERIAPGLRAPVKVAYKWKQQHATVLSPTTVLLVSEGETLITPEDRPPASVPLVQTTIWVQRDGVWKILHAHQSSPPR